MPAMIALNIRLRGCLTVVTPFDRMACKVKSCYDTFKRLVTKIEAI
jgi:hypothetical protein